VGESEPENRTTAGYGDDDVEGGVLCVGREVDGTSHHSPRMCLTCKQVSLTFLLAFCSKVELAHDMSSVIAGRLPVSRSSANGKHGMSKPYASYRVEVGVVRVADQPITSYSRLSSRDVLG
jgi:hypothetical protein